MPGQVPRRPIKSVKSVSECEQVDVFCLLVQHQITYDAMERARRRLQKLGADDSNAETSTGTKFAMDSIPGCLALYQKANSDHHKILEKLRLLQPPLLPLFMQKKRSKMTTEQRKVLEDIQRTKRLLKEGAAASLGMHTSNPIPAPILPTPGVGYSPQTATGIGEMMMNPGMRSAMQVLAQANLTSFGFFVPQDSHFGNSILPVLPRLDAPPPPAATGSSAQNSTSGTNSTLPSSD